MRFFIMLLVLAALVSADTYITGHDDMNPENMVGKIEYLQSFVDCFTDKGPCNEVQGSIKVILAEAIQQGCAKCTDAQKYLARRFIAALKEKLPEGYTEFKKKYDPENKYFTTLERAVANAERS